MASPSFRDASNDESVNESAEQAPQSKPLPESAAVSPLFARLALLVFSPARAQNDESELASIRDQITNLSQTLNADAAALRETRERSFELKKQVDPFRSKQSELEARLTAKQSQVKSLGTELSKFQNQLNTLLDGIRGAAIQQYVIASQPTLKMRAMKSQW